MTMTTSLLVRVQALGGKFLGPDIGYSLVTIRDVLTGNVLAQGLAEGDSGQLVTSAAPPAGATTGTIVTGSTFQWLVPTSGSPSPTAGLQADFDLDQPMLVEISADTLTNGMPNGHRVAAQTWLVPGVDAVAEPGLVLTIPGLNVQILTPNVLQPASSPLKVEAWVTMMCGCKISDTTDWRTDEFTVTAMAIDAEGNCAASKAMTLQQTSVFCVELTLPSGDYQLVVTAVQGATSNQGSASMFIATA